MAQAAPAGGEGGVPAIRAVRIGAQGEVQVNGSPFLPLMGFYQSVESFRNAPALGLNGYFMPGAKPPPREYLDALREQGLYGIVPFDATAAGHPALLAFVLPHEPDKAFMNGKADMSPDAIVELAAAVRRAEPGRPVILDWSPRFMRDPVLNEGLDEKTRQELYPAYAKAADVLTYNVYPIWGHNRPERIDWVAEAADDLKALAGEDRPFFAMIETGRGGRGIPVDEAREVSAAELRSEVWMALIGGARGIVYFTHRFVPSFTEFAPDAARQAEIRAINEQITRLAPALLAPAAKDLAVSMTLADGLAARCRATRAGDGLYLFAQNIDMGRRGGVAVFTVPGLRPGAEIVVMDEDRTLVAEEGGRFRDEFGPLAVRIYRLADPARRAAP